MMWYGVRFLGKGRAGEVCGALIEIYRTGRYGGYMQTSSLAVLRRISKIRYGRVRFSCGRPLFGDVCYDC